jgi:hypothetical protein
LHSGSLALKIAPVFFSGRWGQRGAGGSIESGIAGKAGFTKPSATSSSPGQETIIDTALGGRDCLVVMPTGGGKSLCYQVPALVLGGLTVVVSPLISLMKDQVDQLLANGVAAACLNSTQSREQQQEVMAGCRSGQIRLLYIAPERLMLDNFLEHLATGTWRWWRWMKRTVFPSGAMISVRNMPPWASCASGAADPVYGVDRHRR